MELLSDLPLDAAVTLAARELRGSPVVDFIRANDPRLGQLLRAVDPGAATAGELARRLLERVSDPTDVQSLRLKLGELQTRVETLSGSKLEDELADIIAAVSRKHRAHIVLAYYGWDGGGGASLARLANECGMSREGTRQLCLRAVRKLEGTRPFAPALDWALRIIHESLPAPAAAVEARLLEHGVTRGLFRLEGIQRAARLLGRDTPFILETIQDEGPALPNIADDIARAIVRSARKAVRHWGVATVADIADQASDVTGCLVTEQATARILVAQEGFHWLDEAGGWFWLTAVVKNRLRNNIRKVLSVAERISLSDLRPGVSRHYRARGVAPPKRILAELCRQLPEYRVENDTVVADPPIDWCRVLGAAEQTMVRMLMQAGPVMQRAELEQLCLRSGLNRNTFYAYLDNSPVIEKYARGVYGLRGFKVPAGIVEALIPKRRRGRVLSDYGWIGTGRLWLGYKVSHGMLSNGVAIIPAALKEFVTGEFTLKDLDGLQVGTLTSRGGNAWGLGKFFRRRGGDPGDYLVISIDLAARDAVVAIGDSSLLDEYQTGEPDTGVSKSIS